MGGECEQHSEGAFADSAGQQKKRESVGEGGGGGGAVGRERMEQRCGDLSAPELSPLLPPRQSTSGHRLRGITSNYIKWLSATCVCPVVSRALDKQHMYKEVTPEGHGGRVQGNTLEEEEEEDQSQHSGELEHSRPLEAVLSLAA